MRNFYVIVAGLLALMFLPATAFSQGPNPLSGAAPLTARRLVNAVLQRNPGVPALHAAAAAAASRVEPAGALDDPMLSYTLAPQTIGSGERLNQGFDLSQEIPWPGTLALREDAARSQAEAASQDLAGLRLEIIAAAKAGFAEWYYVHRALAINAANKELLIELRNVAETQYAAGRATQQDVIQAELEHTRLLQEALALKREQRSLQAHINSLLNRAPGEYLAAPAKLAPPASPPGLQILQQTAVENHPELKRLEAQLNVSRARVGLTEKDFYPDLRIMTGYSGLWDEEEKRFTVGFSINLPWNRSKYRQLGDAARADGMRAQWHLADRRAQLLAALARARAEVAESVDVIELHHDLLVPLVQDNLNAAVADYRAGAGDFLDVITAENRKLMVELELARAQADYVRRRAEMARWSGGVLPAAHGSVNEGRANE